MICHFSRPQSCSWFTLRAIEYVVVFCFLFFYALPAAGDFVFSIFFLSSSFNFIVLNLLQTY